MIDGLKRINQSGIKDLILKRLRQLEEIEIHRRRLAEQKADSIEGFDRNGTFVSGTPDGSPAKNREEDPESYVDIPPLVIWRADYNDGIQKRILEEVFEEYNKGLSKDDRKWYSLALLCGSRRTVDDFTSPTVFRRDALPGLGYGRHKSGLIVIDPILVSSQNKMGILESVINSHTAYGRKLYPVAPVIVFMNRDDDWFETPEKYPDAEQYVFEPDFEEWAKWAESKDKYPKEIIDFIRGDGDIDGIKYRWYNRFTSDYKATKSGCVYPFYWRCISDNLRSEMRPSRVRKLSNLTNEQIESSYYLAPHISDDVKQAFSKYLAVH